jgi:acyl carrier protein
MSGDIPARVIGILAAQALVEPADIAPDATIESLGLDSLGMVEAIFAIEEAFDISVPFNPGAPDRAPDGGPAEFDISTVASIIAAVEGLVAQKAA